MTDLLLHPDDSGEVARLPGETARLITAAERNRLLGEQTENLGQYFRPDAPFGYLRKTIELDDTVFFHIPETIGIVPDLTQTDQLTILGSLADAYVGLDGELEGPQSPPPPPPKPKLRRSVPLAAMVDREPPGTWGRMRHRGKRRRARRVSPWLMLAAVVVFGVAVYAGAYVAGQIVLAVLAVVR